MRFKTRLVLAAATVGVVGAFSLDGSAQQVGYSGGVYQQNFDSLPSTGYAGSTIPNVTTPFDLTQPFPTGVGAGAALSGWYAAHFVGAGTGANAMKFYTTNGADIQASIGGLGSFGATDSTERALGAFANTGNESRFGVKFVNNSATPITAFTVDYDVEQWSLASTTIDFRNTLEYAVGAADLNSGAYTMIGTADTNPGGGTWNAVLPGSATNATLDGNDPLNRTHKNFTVTGLNWQPGQSLFLRWNDVNDANIDAGLAIDNFSFVGATIGNVLTWKGTPNGTWNNLAANTPWLNGNNPAFYSDGDIVTFAAIPSNATITVDVGGVTPGSTTINNPANTYTFTGAAINGPLIKTGAGTAVFTSVNNFNTVNIAGGTVELQVSDALGLGAAVTLGDGTIKISTTDHTFSNALVVTGNGVISTSVPLTITGSVNGAQNTTLTIENTSNTPVLVPGLQDTPSAFAGGFHVKSGVVKFSGTTDTDMFNDATVLTVDAGATFDFGINGDSFGGLQGAGNIILTDTPGSFLNFRKAGDRTFSGIISGTTTNATSQGLHQAGGGVLTLTGKSTFVAPTTVSNGTILIGANVLNDTDSPLGHSSLPITMGLGGAATTPVSLLIGGAFEIQRPINIISNTNTVAITLGGTTDDNSVFSGPIDMGKSPRLTSVTTGNKAVTFSGPILASGPNAHGLTKIGTGVVVLSSPGNTYTGTTNVNEGTLRVTGSIATSVQTNVNNTGTYDAAAKQTLQALTINNGGTVKVTKGALTVGNNTTAAPLVIASATGETGTLDVTTNGLIVDYIAGNEAAALTAVRDQIIRGYNATAPGAGDGNWKGPGITSSNAGGNKAVGYAQASEIPLGAGNTFLGSVVDADAIVVRYTLTGDANLDGNVGFSDLVAVAQHYGVSDGSGRWVTGDFNFDGNVGFADLVAVAQNYGGALPASVPGATPAFAAALASVPEPSMLSLVGVGAMAMMRRRRR